MFTVKEITPKYEANYPPNEANTEDAVKKVRSSTLKMKLLKLLSSSFDLM